MSDTQRTRVLRALRAVGGHGLTQIDWLRHPTADGGPPITRLAARVEELRNDGNRIENRGRRDSCVVYVLVGVAADPAAAHPPGAADALPRVTSGVGRETDEYVSADQLILDMAGTL